MTIRAGFRIKHGCGFEIALENGYAVSVMFGAGSRSENQNLAATSKSAIDFDLANRTLGEHGSANAECAVLAADGSFVRIPGSACEWASYQSPAEFLQILHWASELPPKESAS